MYALFLTGWRSGLRGRAIYAVTVVALLLVGVAWLAAAFSPRQPQTVALDVGYSGLRICLVLFGLFWVEQLLSREIGSRGILLTLSYPVPRSHYLLARYAAILALLALAALLLGGVLWGMVAVSSRGYMQSFPPQLGLPFWSVIFGLWLDAAVVAAFAFAVACVATVPMLPLAMGLAFAVGGKTLGAVLDYLARGADSDPAILQMAPLLNGLQWLIPDLSRFDWRMWPLYGVQIEATAMFWIALMGVGYILVMLALAVQAFERREFN